jgi:hypothetical protein
MREVYGYDFDGVISVGITPRSKDDVIITGRCLEESEHVLSVLKERGIDCTVFFNPMSLEERGNHSVQARTYSGKHKARTIKMLESDGVLVTRFFEDDEIQLAIAKEANPNVEFVHIVSTLVEK